MKKKFKKNNVNQNVRVMTGKKKKNMGTHRLDKMLPMAGLHISHPRESGFTPISFMISGSVRRALIFTTLNKSIRLIAKWGHRFVLRARPAFFISELKMLVTWKYNIDPHPSHEEMIGHTRGMQPPHPVPTFVFALRSGITTESPL